MNSTQINTIPEPESDSRELPVSLVLPGHYTRPAKPVDVQALGRQLDKLLAGKTRIGLTGLHAVSNQAIDLALSWATRRNATLLVPELPGMLRDEGRPVSQHIMLAEACQSDLILWVGCTGSTGPVADWITQHQLLGAFLPGDLKTVQQFRALLRDNPRAAPVGEHKRVAVVIGPEVDRLVSGQWHKLCADQQTHSRMGVLALPDAALTLNARGLFSAVGVHFGLGVYQQPEGQTVLIGPEPAARLGPSPSEVVSRAGVDVVLDFALTPTLGQASGEGKSGAGKSAGPPIVRVCDLAAAPGLWRGMQARVSRFDGQAIALAHGQGDSDWVASLFAEPAFA